MAAAYLFTWNPGKFQWEKHWPGELAKFTKKSRDGQTIELSWSCAKSTLPQRGDRAFFIKLGRYGRGIFASGWITRSSHVREESDFGPRGVEIECDAFLNANLEADLLDPAIIDNQHWTPQSSGATINPSAYQQLEQLWLEHLRTLGRKLVPRDISDEEGIESFELEALEGELREYIVKHRRRERALRGQKLLEFRRRHGRVFCEVCNFDFAATFGVDYAEVHHIKPLSSTEEPRLTRLVDLAVLCANCHRVAHIDPRRTESLAQLRSRRQKYAHGAARSLPR